MTDYAKTYRALRGRVSDLVRDADAEQLEQYAPAAPEWRVRDVVAHLCGITADVNAGNLDGVATDSWTARQVDARRDRSIEQILDEWDAEGAKVEAVMSNFPEVAVGQMTMDAATHEQDIRGVPMLAATVDPANATLRIETDIGTATVGTGERRLGVRVERYELFRTMTGRRSAEQIRSFDWDGEATPELLVFPIFRPRATPLVE
jgi:uncharacterized protein (TIGR03083 family)